jgi:hypothetical protein
MNDQGGDPRWLAAILLGAVAFWIVVLLGAARVLGWV